MRALKKLYTILALGLAMPLACVAPARATVFQVNVSIDPSVVSGDAVMAFEFYNSDDGENHELVIWDFASSGLLANSASADPCPTPVFPFDVNVAACKDPKDSSVTGTFGQSPAVPVTISDEGSALVQVNYYQRIKLSDEPLKPSFISFSFEMSGYPSTDSASPDGFAFSLLKPGDPGSNPIGDLFGPGPLLVYTFQGSFDGVPNAESCDTTFSEGLATCTEVRASVPEPTPLALTVAALLALLGGRRPVSALHPRRAVRA